MISKSSRISFWAWGNRSLVSCVLKSVGPYSQALNCFRPQRPRKVKNFSEANYSEPFFYAITWTLNCQRLGLRCQLSLLGKWETGAVETRALGPGRPGAGPGAAGRPCARAPGQSRARVSETPVSYPLPDLLSHQRSYGPLAVSSFRCIVLHSPAACAINPRWHSDTDELLPHYRMRCSSRPVIENLYVPYL